MSSAQQPLRISGWQDGIGDSPHVGLGLIRCADIDSYPGAVKVGKKPQQLFHKINTRTFTVDPNLDIGTASDTIEANSQVFSGAAVYFTTTGTLPAGLSTGTIYFLYYQSPSTFQVCTSYKNSAGSAAGTTIDITNTGSGVHTMNAVAISTIKWIIKDPRGSGRYFMIGANGRVWFQQEGTFAFLLLNSTIDTPASGITNGEGNGIVMTQFSSTTSNFLFVFRNALIDVIDVFGTTNIETPVWSNGWKSLNAGAGSGAVHQAIRAQDDAIYFCDNRYVGSIIENAGSTFDPASGATFTYNNQALDLPVNEVVRCLEELGADLLIGGNTFNYIYPWDRISDSFSLPIPVPEKGIKLMKNVGGQVYVLPSTYGNIYVTQGTYVKFVRKIPTHVVNSGYIILSNPVSWLSIAESNGSLLMGLTAVATAAGSGVWRLFPDGRLIQDNYPSTGVAGVSAIYPEGSFYLMGYNGGADNFLLLQQYSNYETLLQSQLMRVGTKTQPSAYSELEVQIATPATSGSIRVSYRMDRTSSFTTLATFTADSATTSFKSDIGLTDLENIQVQVELSGNVEFVDVILHP